MKSLIQIITTFALITLPIISWAQRNPQIRQCRQVHGQFITVVTADDQVGLCRLGSAYIGSLDLLTYLVQESMPLSVEVYSKSITSCDPLGVSKTVQTLEGDEIRACFFADGSLIEMSTLQRGRDSSKNSKLNAALGL